MSAIGFGLIGCGAFGRFCLAQYRNLPDLVPRAVADADPGLAEQTARDQGLEAVSVERLLARSDIDWVHIATPPGTHRALVLAALAAGKHVLCEKPLALDRASAQEMLASARKAGKILAVNLIMRYNPLAQLVKTILEEKLLGEVLHASFENWAQDETLGPGHWFWNRPVSGGIFVEHAVHFFDLFEWWLGPGEVRSAWEGLRPGSGLAEAVASTSVHSGVPLTMYHGFQQARRMDRQEFRILLERGDILLREWVPTSLEIHGLLEGASRRRLEALIPHVRIERLEAVGEPVSGRHKTWAPEGRYRIGGTPGLNKDELYRTMVTRLLGDQLAFAADPSRTRLISEENGLRSLEMALSAADLAARL